MSAPDRQIGCSHWVPGRAGAFHAGFALLPHLPSKVEQQAATGKGRTANRNRHATVCATSAHEDIEALVDVKVGERLVKVSKAQGGRFGRRRRRFLIGWSTARNCGRGKKISQIFVRLALCLAGARRQKGNPQNDRYAIQPIVLHELCPEFGFSCPTQQMSKFVSKYVNISE
jgi:hypothetical protein